MKARTCPKCAEVKAQAMAQLGLINQWQGRVLDMAALLRRVESVLVARSAQRGTLSADEQVLLCDVQAALKIEREGQEEVAAIAVAVAA